MNALEVRIGENKVGVLERFEDERQRFSFCDEYVNAFISSRPILGQIFEDRFPAPISVDGPLCWFTHLLPQGVMLRWRLRLLGLDEFSTFELLEQLGHDLPGAVRLIPCESPLRPTATAPVRPAESPETQANRFRFSLAGAQWKLSARSSGRGLTTRAVADGIACIAKFHSPEYPGLPQCEFATMAWARAAGIRTPDFELRHVDDFDQVPEEMPTGEGAVFVIQRFDRTPNGRMHIEDFGQILDRPPGYQQYVGSYEEIASVLRWIAPESAEEFLKTVIFHILCGNGDAHLKNFSVIYPDGRNAVLTPAYDIVSTILYVSPGKEELALSLAGKKQFRAVNGNSFTAMIEKLGLDQAKGMRILVDFKEAAFVAWRQPDIQSLFSKSQIERLQKHLDSLQF